LRLQFPPQNQNTKMKSIAIGFGSPALPPEPAENQSGSPRAQGKRGGGRGHPRAQSPRRVAQRPLTALCRTRLVGSVFFLTAVRHLKLNTAKHFLNRIPPNRTEIQVTFGFCEEIVPWVKVLWYTFLVLALIFDHSKKFAEFHFASLLV